MKKFLLFFSLFISGIVSGQNRYQISDRDIVFSAVLLPLNAGGFRLYHDKFALTAEQINSLNPNDVNAFDRGAIKHYSLNAMTASDALLYSSLAAPAFLLIDKEIRQDAGSVGVVYFQSLSLTALEITLLKALIKRPRPFVYNRSAPMNEKLKPDAAASFASGHTAITATATFFAANTLIRYNGENKAWIYSAAAALPLTTGYFRYRAGKHFPTDIAAGLALGILNSILINSLH